MHDSSAKPGRLNDAGFLEACSSLCQAEPVFDHIRQQYGFPPFWKRPEGFDTLVQIILEQQVSLASARAHYLKLKAFAGEIAPWRLLGLSDQDYYLCQVSRQKAACLRALSDTVQHNRLQLESLSNLPEDEVHTQLCSVKGIGRWTSHVYLMFCLNRPDCFPTGDVAIINALRQLFPEISSFKLPEIYQFAAKWSPRQTAASYFLWWWYLKSRNRQLPAY